jgi:hypothetical protein
VTGAGYDEVNSSEAAFERTAALLKWVLLRAAVAIPSTADDVGAFLRTLTLAGRI